MLQRSSGSRAFRATVVFTLLLGSCFPLLAATRLSSTYKSWIDHDVVYIASHDEREAFLKLNTDAERDSFMEHFWAIRNPDPGAPTNNYKEEHYRRLSYVDQWYSSPPGAGNGWRTDRGRIYIQLGAPKQKAQYLSASQTRPFEIWFYDNANPALPPFFNVLFYQKDIGSEFKLYSPYMDGPDKLTTSVMAVNDRKKAFDLIDKQLGREVARTTLSLVPGEPVDIDSADSSLGSDVMLSVIRNLPNNPFTKDMIARNADLLSNVSHRIILSGDYLDVLTTTLRDSVGDTYVHYLLRVRQPVDFAIAKTNDGRYYYNVDIAIVVRDENNRVVMTQNYPLSKYLAQNEYDQLKANVFGVEGILPLPPGKYKAEMILTNKIKNSAWKVDRDLAVESGGKAGLAISQIMGFSSLAPSPAQFLPFAMGGLKFTPQLNDELTLFPGQPLTVMYQLWNTPGDPKANSGKTLHVEYTYGSLGTATAPMKVQEDVAMDQFDRFGSMTTGKKLSTEGMNPGNYRLLVSATDPDSGKKVFSSLSFQISSTAASASWNNYDNSIPAQYANGGFDLMRGNTLIAMGHREEGLPYIERAYGKNSTNEITRDVLAGLYFENKGYSNVIQLYGKGGVNQQTSDETVLNFAQSFAKTGKLDSAVDVLESALSVKSPSQPLYLALASYYDQLGNPAKSAEVKRKIESINKN